MRSVIFAAVLVALGGVAATAQTGNYTNKATALQERDGGSATGGPAGGLNDRN